MPNPRYLTEKGKPQVELLRKLDLAKAVYLENIKSFCEKNSLNPEEIIAIKKVFLIGSNAEESRWDNDGSDLDLKLVNSTALPENLLRYKRKVLDPILCNIGKPKKYWIDLFFAHDDYQVTLPRWDITEYWEMAI